MKKQLSISGANEISPALLAYMGDCVYDLYIRSHVIENFSGKVNDVHLRCVSCVNAASQAEAAKYLLNNFLSEDEIYIFKRGRNAKTGTTPKNMDILDYRLATGLETLIGFLYLTGNIQRLDTLFEYITDYFFGEKSFL